MARDVNLKLADSGTPITNTTGLAAKDTEGNFRADVRLFIGTITDADETLNLTVEAATDGSNYFHIGEFPLIVATDDSLEIARPVYVPRPDPGTTVTKVRLKARAVAGTTPSFPISAWLEPVTSLGAPATDETGVATGTNGRRGLACLT